MNRAALRARQAGVGLMTAIFLLVVLAGLAVAMVSVFSAQQASIALDVQGARAYQAARAGIEWGLFQQLRGGKPCTGASSFALPGATSSLGSFTVTVSCTSVDGPGADPLLTRRVLRATACNQPDAALACPNAGSNLDYVERVLEVQL